MKPPRWLVRLLDRFAEWILTFTRRPECPHCGAWADGTIETQPATEDDPIAVRTWVCAACVHKT